MKQSETAIYENENFYRYCCLNQKVYKQLSSITFTKCKRKTKGKKTSIHRKHNDKRTRCILPNPISDVFQ